VEDRGAHRTATTFSAWWGGGGGGYDPSTPAGGARIRPQARTPAGRAGRNGNPQHIARSVRGPLARVHRRPSAPVLLRHGRSEPNASATRPDRRCLRAVGRRGVSGLDLGLGRGLGLAGWPWADRSALGPGRSRGRTRRGAPPGLHPSTGTSLPTSPRTPRTTPSWVQWSPADDQVLECSVVELHQNWVAISARIAPKTPSGTDGSGWSRRGESA